MQIAGSRSTLIGVEVKISKCRAAVENRWGGVTSGKDKPELLSRRGSALF